METESEQKKLLQEKLQRRFMKALIYINKFRLFHRPHKLKFDESDVIVRLDIDEYKGFSIGDLCVPPLGIFPNCLIAAFVEMTGHLKSGHGIKIKNMFCILASFPDFSSRVLDDYSKDNCEYFLRTQDGSIYLFEIGDFKKAKEG